MHQGLLTALSMTMDFMAVATHLSLIQSAAVEHMLLE